MEETCIYVRGRSSNVHFLSWPFVGFHRSGMSDNFSELGVFFEGKNEVSAQFYERIYLYLIELIIFYPKANLL